MDHVVPQALGGSDDPSNLVAACRDCNAGKAASNPDAPLVQAVADDALRWAAAIRRAADVWLADRDAGYEYGQVVAVAWDSGNDQYRSGWARIDDDWTDSAERWRTAGVPAELVADAIGIAMRRRTVQSRDVWRYACGIVWSKLTELQDAARANIGIEPAADHDPDADLGWHNRAWRKGYLTALEHNQRAENGDPAYPVRASAYQYLALARVVDAEAMSWVASL